MCPLGNHHFCTFTNPGQSSLSTFFGFIAPTDNTHGWSGRGSIGLLKGSWAHQRALLKEWGSDSVKEISISETFEGEACWPQTCAMIVNTVNTRSGDTRVVVLHTSRMSHTNTHTPDYVSGQNRIHAERNAGSLCAPVFRKIAGIHRNDWLFLSWRKWKHYCNLMCHNWSYSIMSWYGKWPHVS